MWKIQKINKIQFWRNLILFNVAARIIHEVPRDTHAEPVLILLILEQLGHRWERHLVKLWQLSPCNETFGSTKTRWSPLSTAVQDSSWKKTFVGDRCYYIQSVVCLILRLRGIMNPISGLGTRSWKWTGLRELGKSTSSALDCANHICQRKMLVNAIQLLLYGKKKTTTTAAAAAAAAATTTTTTTTTTTLISS